MQYSQKESLRFGLRVCRATLDDIVPAELSQQLAENKVDIAIIRIPAEKQYKLQELNDAGLHYLVADTLVYYRCDLQSTSPEAVINSDVTVRPYNQNDAGCLNKLIRRVFDNYTNHYRSNLYFGQKNMLEGYQEWVLSSIGEFNKDIWIIEKGFVPVGFGLIKHDDSTSIEGELIGITPEASGAHAYTDAIRLFQLHYQAAGKEKFSISTQVQNYSVQKVWSREHFALYKAEITLHLNVFLGDKKHKPVAS